MVVIGFTNHRGIAQVTIEEKIGFINYKGEFVIPCIYDDRDYWVFNRDRQYV